MQKRKTVCIFLIFDKVKQDSYMDVRCRNEYGFYWKEGNDLDGIVPEGYDTFPYILNTPEQVSLLLSLRGEAARALRDTAHRVKMEHVGDMVYLRALVEMSNACRKDCYYCGIRKSNSHVHRYVVSDEDILAAARFAYKEGFGSMVLQAGERQDEAFVARVERLIGRIMEASQGELGLTLSLGEQSRQTLLRWKAAGAVRYLLRIETSNKELYSRLHPSDHLFEERLACLANLRDLGFHVGSGIMIGLPFQSTEQIASDLLFLKQLDVDMVGMGPYIEHHETPLWEYRDQIPSREERYHLSMNAWAVLRLLMPDINIASTTAIGSISPKGREEALYTAANVIMPNLTPFSYRKEYFLYENKICIEESHEDSKENIERIIRDAGCRPGYFQQGNSLHFSRRNQK